VLPLPSLNSLLIVVPAFNEEQTIGHVVNEIHSHGFRVVVVDDCSTDRTARRASEAGAIVLRLPINLGVGGALRAGFRYAVEMGYTAVVQVDADGQHPTKQISDLVRSAYKHRAHLVIGSRYLSLDTTLTSSLPRRFSMWCLSKIGSRISGVQLSDTTSGFRLISQPLLGEFARQFPSYYLGDTFEATIAAARAGYRVTEVPAALAPRVHGNSSASSMRASLLIARVLIVSVMNLRPHLKRFQD
jgi:glycosyltransferase involved in cell wall biosynthesis